MALDRTLWDCVFDAVNGGLIVLDRNEKVLRWNAWMETASGVSAAQAGGQSLAQIFPGIQLKRLSSAIAAALAANASTIITHALNPNLLPLRTRSHRELLHDITVSPLSQKGDTGCLVFIMDVTLAARRERYLRDQQNARYDAVVASSPDAIITVNEDGLIEFVNSATQSRFGFSKAQLVGKDAAVLFETQNEWNALWHRTIEGAAPDQPTELVAARAGFTRRYLEASASRWKSGTRLFATVILRDVTERRAVDEALRQLNQTLEVRVQTRTAQLMKAEEALRQSQKMEAIGNLTGGIAHDFNNLLHVISGNLQLLKRDVIGNRAAERRLQIALDGVSRSAKLSSQLLAFARRQPLAPKVINLGRFIHDMEDILRRAVGEGVTVETIIGAELWNTLIDPGNVENALLNLAINARDAMDGHGRLIIEASNVFLDAEYANAHDEVTQGEYVVVAVTDTGSGMSPEVIEHVFEPFFTTKPEGRGTGLGLSMVYGFVKQSGGHIRIQSEVGHGTTLKLYLPRSTQPEDHLAEIDAIPAKGGNEMILVAEDNEAVRETVVAMLNDLGYHVVKAKDAQSALSIIESGMPIDLLFTDVIMPGPLKSTELARKARERMPHLAVLFTSGYTDDAILDSGRPNDSVELLTKPYSRETLARKLRHMLANVAQLKAVHDPKRHGEPAAPKKTLRILVCEDDVDIRDTTVDILSSIGHQAMSASDARAALSILKSNPIDILLTDVGLPDMSGATLAEYATSRFPALAVIFATGRSPGPTVPGSVTTRTLVKPFSYDDLVAVITSLTQAGENTSR